MNHVGELDPHDFYFDLRDKVTAQGSTYAEAHRYLRSLTADPLHANPVIIVQFGLGALQLRDPEMLSIAAEVVTWLEDAIAADGLIPYRFAMWHTFPLDPVWHSALAQGEAGSFLVRCAQLFDRPELYGLAERAVLPLIDPASNLVSQTPEGPVLQEYPTDPPSHVLNGWITALWGLHDVATASRGPDGAPTPIAEQAARSYDLGIDTLVERLGRYRLAFGWSLYDLYPLHPLPNVTSPFYHRHHILQLQALTAMTPRPVFAETLDEWERALRNPLARTFYVGRKVAFRLIRPRWRRLRATPDDKNSRPP